MWLSRAFALLLCVPSLALALTPLIRAQKETGDDAALISADGTIEIDAPSEEHLGTSKEGLTSAVLTAMGEGSVLNRTVPECFSACETYNAGVDETTENLCIDAWGTCSVGGCGWGGTCRQKFNDECTDHCSEWAEADINSPNVCQDKVDTYKCSASKACNPAKGWRCKQKKAPECFLFCEGYETSGNAAVRIDQNSGLVCQNLNPDSTDLGVCLPLPCSMTHHNTGNYRGSQVCKQTMPWCKNSCAEGSDEPNTTTVCFDEYSEVCQNHAACPDTMTRCTPVKHHMNESAVNKEDLPPGWRQETVASLAQGPGQDMTQAEWRQEQQRVRIEALRSLQQQPKMIMRRDGAEKED